MKPIRFPVAKRLPSWEETVKEFILFKKSEGRAKKTIQQYQEFLGYFHRKHPDGWPDYHELKKAVREYFAHLSQFAPATYNLNRAYLKSFFNWCVREGYLNANPIDGIPKRKDSGKPRSLDEEAVKAVLSLVDTSTYTGLRDYALILLQLDTGIRPGEALQLLPKHLNLSRLEVYIPASIAKTRTARTVVISTQTAKAIKKLLLVRPDEWKETVPVFCNQDGRQMLVSSWTHRLKKYGQKGGVNISAYQLRHTSAIMQLRNGASAFHVQKQLGHADMQMTKRYVHLVEADLHREHASCSPVANLLPERKRVQRKVERGRNNES